MQRLTKLRKRLSRNDLGLTGAHQAGVLIPKHKEIVDFFPKLDPEAINPRVKICFYSQVDARNYDLNFIYYNGKVFGTSTRNEFRLTGLTAFYRDKNLQEGDWLILMRDELGNYSVGVEHSNNELMDDVIVLSGTWFRG